MLLLVRRTRTIGAVLALAFHAVVALDRTHQFFDFSAVLSAVFVTFLPDAGPRRQPPVASDVCCGRHSCGSAPCRGARSPGSSSAVAADRGDRMLALDAGWIAWQALVLVVGIALVGALLAHRREAPANVRLRPGASLVVIALVVANGVLPYLEVKTATGWNMYANLRTVDGDSNHFLIRATLPITDPQDDLVTVVSSSDSGLQAYANVGLLLPVRSVRAYLQDHDDVDAVLEIDGDRVVLDAGDPIPERLGPPVPEWVRRLFVLRAVSTADDVPCQDTYFAAT